MRVMWLLFMLLIALFYTATPTEPIWYQLHQQDYDVILQRMEIKWFNNSYFRNLAGGIVHYNRTQKAVNISLDLLKDLTNDCWIEVQIYKYASNEYRDFPASVGLHLCREYNLNSFGVRDLFLKYSNVRHCPVEKGFYTVAYAVLDFSKWPPYIPRGEYKLEIKGHQKTDFVGEAHFFCEIKDKPLKWKE